ncbi:MAG: hypothetical protein ACP5UA_06415 [Candidatus Hydrogenedens sp.]
MDDLTLHSVKIFPPTRGFLFHTNHYDEIIPLEDLKKWGRIQYDQFKVEKIDFFSEIDDNLKILSDLSNFTKQEFQCKISWGTTLSEPPQNIEIFKEAGILDIFLLISNHTQSQIYTWIKTCQKLDIPLRIYSSISYLLELKPFIEIESFKSVASVVLFETFPFSNKFKKSNILAKEQIKKINELVQKLIHSQIPLSILGIPFCVLESLYTACIVNSSQFYADSDFYTQPAFEFAQMLWKFRTYKIRKILEMKLREKISFHSGIDNIVLPWILNHPALYIPLWAWHKLTRHLKWRRNYETLPENTNQIEQRIIYEQKKKEKEWGICSNCYLRYICDKGNNPFWVSQFELKPSSGNPIRNPLFFRIHAFRYSMQTDYEKRSRFSTLEQLYEEGIQITLHHKPWKEIAPEDYEIENRMTHYMPGAVRWFSFNCGELQSTPLCKTEPPLTISITFGGGFAEQIGFSFGPHIKIVCPMIAQSHKLTLHINEKGHYILIRDKEIVYPTEFFNASLVPPRLPQKLEPRISIWNIDGEIVTQGITLWKPEKESEQIKTTKPKFSFLYVCSRYSNRLRASLLSIAHQKQFDLNQIEVVVAYVPDLDATDDVLDCFESTFPNIKVVRSPFSPSYWKSKGFLINASLPLCSADWTILIDADIILHPDFLYTMDKIEPDIYFVAPDGRKMLTPEITSQILLGLIHPWEQFNTLLEGPGEWRRREADGIPIGYCQCCRKEVFQKIQYPDFNHFEGADWFFGRSVVEMFGPEHRLIGVPVLHLDHGGSQWYGSQKHR